MIRKRPMVSPARLFALAVLMVNCQPAALSARDVPYVPSPEAVVETMVDLADLQKGDVVLDLGSGDGRIVIRAAQKGAQATGIDIDPKRIAEAMANAAQAGVEDSVRFVQGDLFKADLRQVDALTMYLLPEVNLALRPKILGEMAPGTRVVSHAFDLGDWKPDQTVVVPRDGSTVHLWIVPAQVDGEWRLDEGGGEEPWRLDIKQTFQEVSVRAQRDGQRVRPEAKLEGDRLTLVWPDGKQFSGQVDPAGRTINGATEAHAGQSWQAVRTKS